LSKKEYEEIFVQHTCSKIIHPFCPESCTKAALLVWKDAFLFASKLYIPLFVVPAIIFQRKQKGLFGPIANAIPSILNSSSFLATLASCVLPIGCALRKVSGRFRPFLVFLGGVFGGFLSILIERRERRKELAVYTMNQSAEALYNMGMYRGYLPAFKYGDVFIFMVASGLLSYFYNHDQKCLSHIKGLIAFLVGDKTASAEEAVPRGSLCKHKKSCYQFTLRSFFRGFMIGCGLRGSLTFLSLLFLNKMYKNPKKLLELSFGPKTTSFGLFLAFFVSAWKGVACLLRNVRVHDDEFNSLIAGFLAGISIIFSRSTEISMYCLSKGVEAVFNACVNRGLLKSLPHGEVLLFSLGTGLIFYNCTLEPFNLRFSYWNFLLSLSGGRFSQFENIAKVYQSAGFLKSGFKYRNSIGKKV